MTGKSIFFVVLVIFVVILGMVGFGMFMTARSGGEVATAEITQILPILVSLVLYFGWLIFLFSWLRPRLTGWLAKELHTQVSESLISGSWQSSGSLWKKVLVFGIESAVFIPAALIPLAAFGLILFR
jgi:hypothetical protein